jgi:hypothetical protein
VEAALLILVLTTGDPDSLTAAKAVAEALHGQDTKAQVVLPPEASKQLAARGLQDADLVARSEKPLAATASDLHLVIVRVERRDSGADRVVEIDLWSGGRRDGMSAVSNAKGDPLPQAADGARRLLREASHDPATAGDRSDAALIAPFMEQADWVGLVAAVEARSDASPRLRHAAIIARLRLGDHDGAVAALAKLKAQAPQHPLTAAAAAAVEADAGGVDALRDANPNDDGGNVLR